MHNKKAGVAIEELGGLLLFMISAVILILVFAFVKFIWAKQTITDIRDYEDSLNGNDALLNFLKMPQPDSNTNMADLILQSYMNKDYEKLKSYVKNFFDEAYGATDMPWDFTIIDSSEKEVFNIKDRVSYYALGRSLSASAIIPAYNIKNGDYIKIRLILGDNTMSPTYGP